MSVFRRISCAVIALNIFQLTLTDVTELSIIKEILSKNILDTTPPVEHNKTLIVTADAFISRIEKFDEKNMELKLQMAFRMSWLDRRLLLIMKNKNRAEKSLSYVLLRDSKNIWLPDIFFSNEISSQEHVLLQPNTYLKIFNDGTVLYSRRISLTLSCPMNLRSFPFDKQMCEIRIETYGSTVDRFVLIWNDTDPVQFAKNLPLLNAVVEKFRTDHAVVKGEYNLLKIEVHFQRQSYHYLKKFYFPLFVVVLLSWIPFWLGRVLIIRIYIAVSSVIYLGWFYSTLSTDVTVVPYNTGLDYWNAWNFIFVLFAALQSTLISYMIKTNTNTIRRTNPNDHEEYKMLSNTATEKRKKFEIVDDGKTDLDAEIMKIKTSFKICFINVSKEVEIIDSVSKLLFPSAYALFIFFYWIRY